MRLRLGSKVSALEELALTETKLLEQTASILGISLAEARQGTDIDLFNPANGRAFYGGIGWSW
jgi:hypothetical protein